MKRNATTELYRDSRGLEFGNIRAAFFAMGHNPQDVKPGIVKNPKLLRQLHEEYVFCWRCGDETTKAKCQENSAELHHLCGGHRGRSDERTNLLFLCSDCHMSAGSPIFPRGEQLWTLWIYAPLHVDWLRLCVLNRSYIPEIQEPKACR